MRYGSSGTEALIQCPNDAIMFSSKLAASRIGGIWWQNILELRKIEVLCCVFMKKTRVIKILPILKRKVESHFVYHKKWWQNLTLWTMTQCLPVNRNWNLKRLSMVEFTFGMASLSNDFLCRLRRYYFMSSSKILDGTRHFHLVSKTSLSSKRI